MKKLLIATLSLSLFAATAAQAGITRSDTQAFAPQQVTSKALGQNNATDVPTSYGSMADIKTPVRSQTEISYPNAKDTRSANSSTSAAERSVERTLAKQNMNS